MFNEYENIRELLDRKASINARLRLLPYDGSPEVKKRDDKAYLYVRKRVGSRKTSTYVDTYSEELYQLLLKTNLERRQLNKELRLVNKLLIKCGFEDSELPAPIMANIDLARSNIKNSIYAQAILEGIGTTFPQTEEIIENGIVNNMNSKDVQKILNLKHAWEFVLDEDVIKYSTDFDLLCTIAKIINEGFYYNGGTPRLMPVTIGGTSYKPPIPDVPTIKTKIKEIMENNNDLQSRAAELCLYCMKTQIFQDGNKRASVIFANHYLISNGGGLLVIEEDKVSQFKEHLIDFYEDKNTEAVKFLIKECLIEI